MNSKVSIHASFRNGKTFLQKSYYTTPLKIADITEGRQNPCLHLMFMSSSPVILDGDHYHIEIITDDHTAVRLSTQSYQRLFSMKEGAGQIMDIKIGEHAFFSYLPHPTVPHKHSLFTSKNRIYLSDNATL